MSLCQLFWFPCQTAQQCIDYLSNLTCKNLTHLQYTGCVFQLIREKSSESTFGTPTVRASDGAFVPLLLIPKQAVTAIHLRDSGFSTAHRFQFTPCLILLVQIAVRSTPLNDLMSFPACIRVISPIARLSIHIGSFQASMVCVSWACFRLPRDEISDLTVYLIIASNLEH